MEKRNSKEESSGCSASGRLKTPRLPDEANVSHKLTPVHLQRRAIVYVRHSTFIQVVQNRESQLRQYNLAGYARELGFVEVETIDEDLGRSASGLVDRPGFQRLVTEICEGQIGAVFCLEASRLAGHGRDWRHLIELCGLVGAVLKIGRAHV